MTIQQLIDFLKEKGLIEQYIKPPSTPEREVRFTDGTSITFDSAMDTLNYLDGMVKAFELIQKSEK